MSTPRSGWPTTIAAGVIIGALETVLAVAFAAFVFGGLLPKNLPDGIGLYLFAAVLTLAILAWRYMDQASDQAFPVVESGHFVGLITAAQAEQVPRLEWGKTRASQVMLSAAEICVLSPYDALGDALQAMDAAGLEHAPVFEGGRLIGMLNRRDIVYRT